ncbi:2101_t:CDS:2 [Paraglomus brasilianum]|uniref:2101_t:CDS:1 n=1 Tax=Paraglomus brasilianum TaxID=144538 RepID=A0A9N9F5Z9_9GLOM|nr:2101_t:CDS:2 [Paraglomus brasilianum]
MTKPHVRSTSTTLSSQLYTDMRSKDYRQRRICSKCRTTRRSMKMLSLRIGKIEALVDVLTKTMQQIANLTESEATYSSSFSNLLVKYRKTDSASVFLSNHIDELKNLVKMTSNCENPLDAVDK